MQTFAVAIIITLSVAYAGYKAYHALTTPDKCAGCPLAKKCAPKKYASKKCGTKKRANRTSGE